MAIKDQCKQCGLFDGKICKSTGQIPDYNMMSCNLYITSGISLEKRKDNINESQGSPITNSMKPSGNMDVDMPKKQRMFEHPFSFKGRIRRLEYGLSYILNCKQYDLIC